MMDYEEKYNDLLEANKKLEQELESYRSKSPGKNEIARDMIFKVFHSASYLMAISKLDTGEYVDVNSTFLKSLGYRKEEIIGRTPDDIHIFTDIEESNKYIRLISKLKKIKDYPVILKTKSGEQKPYLFSAETLPLDDEIFLFTLYDEISASKDKMIKESQGSVLNEIIETVSSYLTLYSVGDDNRFYIVDLNSIVEKVEFIRKSEVLGKCIDDTPLFNRVKLVELLHYVRITGNAHKLASSPGGDDSEGYYMGFHLSSGNIIITWEPGIHQKKPEDLHKQGGLSEKFTEMLPEMIYKEFEDQIKREKVFLENLIDSTPEAIAIIDTSGKISRVNKEFTNLFGYTSEEAVNRFINDLVVPDDLKQEALQIDALVSVNHKEVRQTIRKDKSGNRIHVSIIAATIVDNNKIAGFLGIYRDITTERKKQLLQEILYSISSASLSQYDIKEIYPIIVQELSKIWDTNNIFISLWDKTSETLSFPFFADEKDSFYEIPSKKTITGWVINKNKPVLLKENELKLLEEAGEIDLIGSPCKVWMGAPLNVENTTIGVICLQDYNDENKFSQDDLSALDFIANQIAIALHRRMVLDNLIHAHRKAEEAAQTKQLFMSTMSHEIRNPLNEVIGITNLLLQGNPGEDQMDYLKALKFSGDNLLTLVNDVLDYNKMESGKVVFEHTQFNLSNFLEEIMRSYSFRSKAKHLSFDIKKVNDLPEEVIGDPIRLNQILSNLLSNALKFTSKGRITVTIKELKRTCNESKIEFTVSDTGIGIPKDKQSIIFESYTQASPDTTRNFGGTGLGLAICKKLIELQGGTITIESEPGKGSTFSFVISIGVSEKGSQAQPVELTENFSGLEGKRILVAEDNKINFFVANKFLVGWGLSVTHADNGQVVLDLLEREDFDLILMDLQMPVIDGIETTSIIRKSENAKIRNIPIVALTAAIRSESEIKSEGLSINDYVLKPFKPHDLFERILKHLR